MKLTAQDLLEFGVIDGIISERGSGLTVVDDQQSSGSYSRLFARIDRQISAALKELEGKSGETLALERFEKFRSFDEAFLKASSSARMENV